MFVLDTISHQLEGLGFTCSGPVASPSVRASAARARQKVQKPERQPSHKAPQPAKEAVQMPMSRAIAPKPAGPTQAWKGRVRFTLPARTKLVKRRGAAHPVLPLARGIDLCIKGMTDEHRARLATEDVVMNGFLTVNRDPKDFSVLVGAEFTVGYLLSPRFELRILDPIDGPQDVHLDHDVVWAKSLSKRMVQIARSTTH